MKEKFYFPHDYEAANDPKLQALLGEYGAIGYGVYWRIVEMLHSDESHKLPLKKYIYIAIAKQMLASVEQIEAIITYAINICELFVCDDDFFWSKRVNSNFDKRLEISEKRRVAGRAGAIAKQNLANASKEKEKKEKKIKVKEYSKESLELNDFSKKHFDQKYINDKSLDTFDNLIRIDNYSFEQVKSAIIFGRTDDFWRSNFLTPNKLREKNKEGVKYIDIFLAKSIKPKPQVQQACR